jgi:hypothetical protein
LTWVFPSAFKFTVIPALLILLYRAIDVLLIMYGAKRNPAMDGIIREKFSAQIPFEDGSFGERPSRDKVTVLILGSKSNQYVTSLLLVERDYADDDTCTVPLESSARDT